MLPFLLRPHHHSIKHRRQGRSKQLRKCKTLGGELGTRRSSTTRLPSATLRKHQRKGPVAATLAAAPWEVLHHLAVQVQMPAAERRWPHSNTKLQYSEGELRKSEAAPKCKAGACQPLPTTGTLRGPIRRQGAQASPSQRLTFCSSSLLSHQTTKHARCMAEEQTVGHSTTNANTASAKYSQAATQDGN